MRTTRNLIALTLGIALLCGAALAEDAVPAATTPGPADTTGQVELSFGENGLNLSCVNADAHEVFARIGVTTGLGIMVNDTVRDRITAQLRGVSPTDAISQIAAAYGLSYAEIGGVIMISEGVPNGPASYLASDIATVPTQYVPAGRVRDLMPTFLQQNIRVNPEQNAVVLSAPSDVLAKFRRDIQQLDIPAKQVMVEVLMVELTNSNLEDLGVRLSWQNGGSGLMTDSSVGDFTYQGVTWLPTGFAAQLTALDSQSRARIRARPRIATVSGHEATIFIGVERFLDKTVRMTGSGDSSSQETSIKAGVQLDLVPFSGTGGVIIVDLKGAEISTLSAPDPVTGLPNKTSRTAKTKVRVTDGQTIVLGGLIQHELRETKGGIPLLRDIPLIGKLFRHKRSENIETELVIFITPRILSQTGHLPEDEERQLRDRFGVESAPAPQTEQAPADGTSTDAP
jgi:type II secretory pathway component GspD/PulD (secretin)